MKTSYLIVSLPAIVSTALAHDSSLSQSDIEQLANNLAAQAEQFTADDQYDKAARVLKQRLDLDPDNEKYREDFALYIKEQLHNIVRFEVANQGSSVDLNYLDVSLVTDMSDLFAEDHFLMEDNFSFNGDISKWNVGNVTDMSGMFQGSSFNGDISKWNVGNVTDMSGMFQGSSFNGDISEWDVSHVTNMKEMFASSEFNGDLSQWDVSSVSDMSSMFSYSSFNGDISKWDVSQVIDMSFMLSGPSFNGDISKWEIGIDCVVEQMFLDSAFTGKLPVGIDPSKLKKPPSEQVVPEPAGIEKFVLASPPLSAAEYNYILTVLANSVEMLPKSIAYAMTHTRMESFLFDFQVEHDAQKVSLEGLEPELRDYLEKEAVLREEILQEMRGRPVEEQLTILENSREKIIKHYRSGGDRVKLFDLRMQVIAEDEVKYKKHDILRNVPSPSSGVTELSPEIVKKFHTLAEEIRAKRIPPNETPPEIHHPIRPSYLREEN